MNADQTLRGEAHDLVLHSGLSGVTGRCTCGAWSGGGRRELPSRVAHQWDAEHLTTLPLEQIDAHGSSVEYQPAEPETASERPDAGRERVIFAPSTDYVYVHDHVNDWWEAWERADDDRDGVGLETADLPKDAGPLFASDSPRPDLYAARLSVAERRASSWWEAAKHWYVCSRQHEAVAKGQTDRADAAEAKLREEQIASTELYGRVFTALGLSIADPWHGLVEAAANVRAERDEARAKLDEIRTVLDSLGFYPSDHRAFEEIRAIVERPAAAPAEPREDTVPCGRDDEDCSLRGGTAHCGGCRG